MKFCQYCDRKFYKTEHLLRHQRSHTGEKPYACPHCDRRYGRSDVLLRHVKYMHDKVPDSAKLANTTLRKNRKEEKRAAVDQDSPLDTQARAAPVSKDVPSSIDDAIVTIDAVASSSHHSQAEAPPVLHYDKFITASMLLAQENPAAEQVCPEPGGSNGAGQSQRAVMENAPAAFTDQPAASHLLNHGANAALEVQQGPVAQERHVDPADCQRNPVFNQEVDNVSPQFHYPNDTFIDLESHLGGDIFSLLHGSNSNLTPHLEYLFPFVHFSTVSGSKKPSSKEIMSSVPAERFSLVSRMWPKKWSSQDRGFPSHLWKGLIRSSRTTTAGGSCLLPGGLPVSTNGSQDTKWGLDDSQQKDLMREFALDSSSTQSRQGDGGPYDDSLSSSSFDGSSTSGGPLGFPSTRLLNLGLFTAFRQSHCLAPFLHQPTFVLREAPNSIVFALCLLGFVVLSADKTREYVDKYLPIAIQKCCTQLVEPTFGLEDSERLVSNLSTATLLLYAVSLHPSQNPQEAKMSLMLYHQAITVAQINGLFQPYSRLHSTGELLDQAHANRHLHNEADCDLDSRWRSWARVESMKRVVAALLVTDSWWSFKLGASPLISIYAVGYDVPCSAELFRRPTARSWKHLFNTSHGIDSQQVVIELHNPRITLPPARNVSPIGMIGLLSVFWIRILDLHRRLISQGPLQAEEKEGEEAEVEHAKCLMVPGAVYSAKDNSSKMLGSGLQKVYANYAHFLQHENPNCVTLWHFLNLQLLVNMETFESATGRYGLERAHSALRVIASWSKTHYARRACLHAAGIYKSMTQRRITDGAMLHTEAAVFLAALVLGMYIFMVHSSDEGNQQDAEGGEVMMAVDADSDAEEPCEMLDDVDWPSLGLLGLVPLSEMAIEDQSTSLPDSSNISASRFIQNETISLSFMGHVLDGGYDGARMIFLEYANLLGELAKGSTEGLGQVLRIMSNSLVDIECANVPQQNS
ncbi:hypothetical protein FE257_006714 [Aspergillus nanangensis]|uniref:C2H2-type domain-containing protein n=1 Tax=Aspergillus nanangensis TaxID=2582783 RepID=A0AAD4CNZ1_ASPNN|nr:hypothetical protein FE257_006714 [Aspergillus nanangensis]